MYIGRMTKCCMCGSVDVPLILLCRWPLKSGGYGRSYCCNPCNTMRLRKYRATPAGAAAARRAVKKYEAANHDRVVAWKKCATLGTKPCEECGEEKTDKHHADPAKPLEVVWLCRLHHKQVHKVSL